MHILEPLTVAAKLTQGDGCHMDQVLLTLGYLVMQYLKRLVGHDDKPGAAANIASIEKWWATADKEVFIAAVILNPFFKTTPFSNHISFTHAGIHLLPECPWLCFFSGSCDMAVPLELDIQVTNYLDGTGIWVDLQKCTYTKLDIM